MEIRGMLRTGVVMASTVAVLATGAAYAQGVPTYENTILTSGHGEVLVHPDSMRLNISVETEASSLKNARRDNNTKMTAVNNAIKALNIPGLKLETSSYSATPSYDPKRQGWYRVFNQVTVTVNNAQPEQLEEWGPQLIDTAMNNGANNVGQLQFYVDAPGGQRQALVKAVEDARANAQTLAGALGVTLNGVYTVESTGYNVPRPYPVMAMRAEAMNKDASNTPIEAGDTTITGDVTVRWRFHNP